MSTITIGLGPRLTPEQRALIRSCPKVVYAAAHQILRRYGPILPLEDLISVGNLAVALAAQSYQHGFNTSFGQWAYYRAMENMIDEARRERRHRRARTAARAAFNLLAAATPREATNVFDETPATLTAELDTFAGMMLVAMVNADPGVADDAEAEIAEREACCAAREALAQAVGELPEDERNRLDLVYRHEHNFLEASRELGEAYWTFVRRHHALVQKLAKRLARLGVREMPDRLDLPPGPPSERSDDAHTGRG